MFYNEEAYNKNSLELNILAQKFYIVKENTTKNFYTHYSEDYSVDFF